MIKEERTKFNSEINLSNNNRNNSVTTNNEINNIRKENFLKKLEEIKHSIHQRLIESNRIRYTKSAISERIKKDLASVIFDREKYRNRIEEHKKKRSANQYYYDYDLELDFSDNPKIHFDIDNRWYYYKAYHYLKIGLFQDKDLPVFKIKISDLSSEMIYELSQLDYQDRQFALKQAVSHIFEDINIDLYHGSISDKLRVKLVN